MYETAGDPKMAFINLMRNANRASELYASNLLKGNLSKFQTMTFKHNRTESNIHYTYKETSLNLLNVLSC